MLETEFSYFLANQGDLVKRFPNKYLVIVGTDVVGAFKNNEMALYEAKKKYAMGTFLIQHCIAGECAYTCTFHSNILGANV